jgi:hypothetical protein
MGEIKILMLAASACERLTLYEALYDSLAIAYVEINRGVL